MDDIKFLKIVLQKIIAVNAGVGVLTLDEALVLIGAYVLKYVNINLAEWRAMNTYVDFLKRHFRGRNNAIPQEAAFGEYAKRISGVIKAEEPAVKRDWLVSFELKLITDVTEEGYLSFNDITFPTYSTFETICDKPKDDFLINFANDHEENHMQENNDDDDQTDITQLTTEHAMNPDEDSNDVEALQAEPVGAQRRNGGSNAPYIQLYDSLKESREDNLQYAWQWMLTLDEYNRIKDCVDDNPIPKGKEWNKNIKTAKLLELYIGEFYKREYDGQNGPFRS